jgi:hypothetical protein
MKPDNSAIALSPPALSGRPDAAGTPHGSAAAGLGFGLLGVLAFSFTLPLTRVAVSQLDPLFVGAGRAVVAGLLAVVVLVVFRQRLPRGTQWLAWAWWRWA